MTGTDNYTIPRYLKIAVNLSSRVASGEIAEGKKLKGRSILATEYNVSPETIRRAMSILSDKSIVKIILGSGIVILSRENAISFVKSFRESENIADMRFKLSQVIEKRKSLDNEIFSLTKSIIDKYQYRRSDLIKPVEVPLPPDSHIIGKSIGELQIWHQTGATVIGVVQDKNIIISPGPYYEFSGNDSVLIVGDENVVERFNFFINSIE